MIIPTSLQDKVLKQVHFNHMDIEKMSMLACDSIYWINMNVDREEIINDCSTCLDFRQHDEKIKQCHMGYKKGNENQ